MDETSGAAGPRPVELVRGLGLLDATLLIVGSVGGSGLFFAPSIMAGYQHSPARGSSAQWRATASSSAARRACAPGTAPRRRPS
jgi:hypothetical protein